MLIAPLRGARQHRVGAMTASEERTNVVTQNASDCRRSDRRDGADDACRSLFLSRRHGKGQGSPVTFPDRALFLASPRNVDRIQQIAPSP